eukprot:scaffold361544_cov103-Cyclotella_meneghiniana.AAC.4
MRRLSVKDHVANRTRNKREINRTDESCGCGFCNRLFVDGLSPPSSVLQSAVVVSKRKRGEC